MSSRLGAGSYLPEIHSTPAFNAMLLWNVSKLRLRSVALVACLGVLPGIGQPVPIVTGSSPLNERGAMSLDVTTSEIDPERARYEFRAPGDIPRKLQIADQVFPHVRIPPGTNVWKLETSPGFTNQLAQFTYRRWLRRYTLDEFNAQNHTMAMVVLKDNKVVCETYGLGASASTRILGYSMTKTVVALLIGVACGEGSIRGLSDSVSQYLPELKGTAYDGVTIENLLQMTSGVSYEMTDSAVEWQKGEKSGPKNYQE